MALLRSDRAVQSIRACPLPAGAAVLFSHRVMHWGARGHPSCTTPRFSLSFGCADPSFERPYLKAAASHLPFPRPAVRAALAAAQLINYHERFAFGAPLLSLFGRVFRAHRAEFTAEYAHKTAAELKSAAEDRARAAAASAVAAAGGVGGGGGGGGVPSDEREGVAQRHDVRVHPENVEAHREHPVQHARHGEHQPCPAAAAVRLRRLRCTCGAQRVCHNMTNDLTGKRGVRVVIGGDERVVAHAGALQVQVPVPCELEVCGCGVGDGDGAIMGEPTKDARGRFTECSH